MTLEQVDAAYKLRIVAPMLDSCYVGALDTSVTRSDSSIVITPTPKMRGCPDFRFTIKADGTGGVREFKRNGEWVAEKVDRVLTLRQ